MTEGTILLTNDGSAKVLCAKVLSEQSFIIECFDERLQFVRLMENDDLVRYGIPFGSWHNAFYGK